MALERVGALEFHLGVASRSQLSLQIGGDLGTLAVSIHELVGV